MCEKAIEDELDTLEFVLDHLKTEGCVKGPYTLEFVPDHAKTQGMCDKAVRDGPFSLQFVSDWFVTQGQIKLWFDDDYYHDDDRLIKWYEDHKKRKAQNAKIKDDLMPIDWHPSR